MSNTDFSTAYWYTSSHMVTSKMYEVHIIKHVKQIYCEIITIYDVLIFAYFMVNWNHENQTSSEKNTFQLICYLCETTNLTTYGSMHCVDTTKIGAHE